MDGLGGLILVMVLMVAMMYFFAIRPQRKQMQEQEKALSQLAPGARVLLANGIFATLREAGKQQVIVELAPGVEVAVLRQVVRRPVNPDEEEFEFVDEGSDPGPLSTEPVPFEDAVLTSHVDDPGDVAADEQDIIDPVEKPDFLPAGQQDSLELGEPDDRQVR